MDPAIRVGFSANSSSWHIEGSDAIALAGTVAGKNRPFMRITAAPYWKNGPSLNSVIETARMQSAWCKEHGIDAITEGDTYSRPRCMVSSAYLEMYDTALRADGGSAGILKYMLDYTGFTSHGILPLLSQWLVTDASLPTAYEGEEGGMLVFGQNADFLTEKDLSRGLILDIKAASLLHKCGVDVGLVKTEPAEAPLGEYFIAQNDSTPATTNTENGFFRATLKEDAEVLSLFYRAPASLGIVGRYEDRTDAFPACYLYENAMGQRFMVYTFAPRQTKTKSEWRMGLFKGYYRQKQLTEHYAWLTGAPLPATANGNPGLYIFCKRDGERLTVGLWNIFPDAIEKPVITLDRIYTALDTFRCTGVMEENRVLLQEPIAPYAFVCFTVGP